MPDPTTTNVVLAVPTRGSDVGTWDTPVNNNMSSVDSMYGSITSKTLSNANVTLSTTEQQVSIIRLSGTLTGNCVVTVSLIKSWIIENTVVPGAFQVTLRGAAGESISPPPGSCQIYYDGTNCKFINLDRIGAYWDYGGSSVPTWVTSCSVPPYLNCTGATFSSGTYPLLFAILGTTTLPDSKGRLRATINQGSGRISTSFNGNTAGNAGGVDVVTLSTTQIPAHSHGVTDPQHTHSLSNGGSVLTATGGGSIAPDGSNFGSASINSASTGISINNAGGGLSHDNMPPTYMGGITMIRAA